MATARMNAIESVQALHDRCAIYTAPLTAAKLLDHLGWRADADLRHARLLEPCLGEGAILLAAISRLLASVRSSGLEPTTDVLAERIVGFEIHPDTAAAARCQVGRLLVREGLTHNDAELLSTSWVQEADFLLAEVGQATHVVANPPYVRWGKLPPSLARTYREAIHAVATRGDLSVAFLHRMLAWAADQGQVVALVSDRWLFAQYGAEFLRETASQGWSLRIIEERPVSPFVRSVGAYSAIIGLVRAPTGTTPKTHSFGGRDSQRAKHAELVARHGTLTDASVTVRVGPALGCGSTYLLEPNAEHGIEPELVRKYVSRADLDGSDVKPPKGLVAVPYDLEGRLIVPDRWPGFMTWAGQHRKALSARSSVRSGAQWWRTIDAVGAQWSKSPKLLLPELCQRPIASLDNSDAVPAHSLYAMWSDEWPIRTLQRVLNAGLLRLTAEALAPSLKTSWYRFYRRFLVQTPLPRWKALNDEQRDGLASEDPEVFRRTFAALFDLLPDTT